MQQSYPAPRLLTINETARLMHLSRSSVYRLILSGALRSLKIGNLRRVRPEYIDAYLDQAEQEQQGGWEA